MLAATPSAAQAQSVDFDIPPQSLSAALDIFAAQSRQPILVTPDMTANKVSQGISGAAETNVALAQLLAGTGLTYKVAGKTFLIVKVDQDPQSGSAAGDGAEVDALIVTAQKREEDIQDVPIAISAFSQEQLTTHQIAGGPDLMTQIPNFTFTKTNFTGYSIQIRGIGTQAISATTDAAVAVAFNNTPFIRNRFFEQEFYDLQRVEVLRGPQGTLYGRNATAGVVNLISQKPRFDYEAKASADLSNYGSHRLEGMVNIPIVEDKVALRLAGAWTKRDGYVTNEITGNPIDGRDLWSTRLSLRVTPNDAIDVNLIWEHFEEDDDRLRSGKQLCKRDDRTEVGGYGLPGLSVNYSDVFNQGCLAESLYSPDSFQAPSGYALPYYHPLGQIFLPVVSGHDPYLSTTQSTDLRVIESTVDPEYRARTDLVELQVSFDITDELTLTSETAYLSDDLFSMQDYNRFNTAEGAFSQAAWDNLIDFGSGAIWRENLLNDGVFCDPQIGCTSRIVAVDSSTANSTQFSQEFRLSSDYDGPFNFSLGANFLRYDTTDKYYVFINALSLMAAISPYGRQTRLPAYEPGVSDNSECLRRGLSAPDFNMVQEVGYCTYLDPNPIGNLNDLGHNYFLSKNPYKLISYAVFGESYYNITDNLEVTAGLRWTVDRKEAPRIPSWILAADSAGYPIYEIVEQEWREPTGRLTIDWKPDLAFTDETLLYASYAHGYKAGGANPPPTGIVMYCSGCGTNADASAGAIRESAAKPKTFDPEFVDAFELGAKNTLLGGRLTVNTAAFYYDYKGYQISQIMDRSAVNYNFDSEVWGLEIEADWRPLENLRLGFKGGYQNTRIADGMKALDIMDRTAGNDDWIVVRPFPTFASNCILPTYTLDGDANGVLSPGPNQFNNGNPGPCEFAYILDRDPATGLPYVPNPTETNAFGRIPPGYPGFDPSTAPNGGAGFDKELGGNELPNAPNFTATITADYTIPLPSEWLMTLHSDFYYQSEAWTRVFNTPGYDKLKAYNHINLAAIFTNEDAGWKVMAYIKNVLDRNNITGAFLNSDDTGLTTNVFLNEPRLYGLRVTKEWTGGAWWGGGRTRPTGEPYPLTVELGGQVQRHDAPYEALAPSFTPAFAAPIDPTNPQNRDLNWGDGRDVKVVWRPEGAGWNVSAGVRYGRANGGTTRLHQETPSGEPACALADPDYPACDPESPYFQPTALKYGKNTSDVTAWDREEHQIVDFAVGLDVGVGLLGEGRSTVQAGLRHAKIESQTHATMFGVPDWDIVDGWIMYPSQHHRYEADVAGLRTFEGVGPMVSWDASKRLLGDDDNGYANVDWSIGGGVLFGKQKASIEGFEQAGLYEGKYVFFPQPLVEPLTVTPIDINRSNSTTVPVLDLSLGLSYEVSRFKIGAGYRWERYFDAIDGGYDKRKEADRTFDGPYLKLSVGFGG